jgi:hypothetical protein
VNLKENLLHRKAPEPGIFKADNFAQEMKIVVRQIQKLHEEKKVPYSDINSLPCQANTSAKY